MNSSDLNNLLQAAGIIVAIILFIFSIILRYWFKRKKANEKYFDICGKSTSRVKINEMLPDRPDHDYYYERKVDNSILDAMKEKNSFVVIGRPLAGKTRAVYEAFRKSKKKYSLYKINSNTKINREDFKIPKNIIFRFRERMLFIDDIQRFTEQENFECVLQEANKESVIISATCRSGEYGIDIFKRNMNSKNLNIESYSKKEIIIYDIGTEIEEEIKQKFDRELKSEKSDGTIGSMFMPLQEMIDRYKECTPENRTILKSIKEMYITGICYGMNVFPNDWVKEVTKHNNLEKNDFEWHNLIDSLIKAEFIKVIKPDNHLRVEEVYLEKIVNGDNESDIYTFQNMLKIFEKNDEALSFLAFKSHSLNNELAENEYFNISIEALTKSFDIHKGAGNKTECSYDLFNSGNIYSDLKKYDEAISDYTKAIELKPDYAETYYNRGNAYSASEKYEEAIADYTKAIELKPDYADAYNNRGIAYYDLKEYDESISDYTKAIELKPDDAETYNNRGIAYYGLKKYDEAISDYTKAIELKPDYADAYNNRGNAYNNLKKYDEAISDYTKAIELKPDYALAYNNRGIAYDDLKKYDEAILDYTKTIELEPDNADAYNDRGIAYFDLKKYDEAIADYTKAIELKPDYAEAYNNRGIAYGESKKYDEAIADFTKAIELKPDDAEAYYNRGIAYSASEKYDEAIADYTKAIELKPDEISAYQNIIEAYIVYGSYREAQKKLDIAKTLKLGLEDSLLLAFLNCLVLRLNEEVSFDAENELEKLLKEDIKLTWSFDELDNWLEKTTISDEKKEYVKELIKKMKTKKDSSQDTE